MKLKDLRTVIGGQVKTDVLVFAGEDNVESGTLWLFDVDDSIDDLEVKDIQPVNKAVDIGSESSMKPDESVLEITLTCTPQELNDFDWDSVFNQKTIKKIRSDNKVTIS